MTVMNTKFSKPAINSLDNMRQICEKYVDGLICVTCTAEGKREVVST
jgi:hypothetical protein